MVGVGTLGERVMTQAQLGNVREGLGHVYDAYRTASMNQKYYRYMISKMQRRNLIFEVVVAIGTMGAGVSGWALWKTEIGTALWAIIAAVAALLAIAKPIVNYSRKIERFSKLYAGYTDIFHRAKELKESIEYEQELAPKHLVSYKELPGLFRELGVTEEDPPKKKLLRKCQDEVNREMPAKSFWMPQSV